MTAQPSRGPLFPRSARRSRARRWCRAASGPGSIRSGFRVQQPLTLLRVNSLLRTQSCLAANFFRSAAARALASADDGSDLANCVAKAECEHRLPGIFQNVENLLWRGFEVNRTAVGQQMVLRRASHGFSQT